MKTFLSKVTAYCTAIALVLPFSVFATDIDGVNQQQTLPTQGSPDGEHFRIGADDYLAVANYFNGSSLDIDSKIYKWDGTQFVDFQSVSTNGAFDWEYFEIAGEHYLAVANHRMSGGGSFEIPSKIYKWDGTQFAEFQSIQTEGAIDWEFFTIGSESYLAIANLNDNVTRNVNSKIYKWDGTQFIENQSIATNGAHDWKHFTIGSDTYLALANHYNGSSYEVNSKIYKWDGTQFVEFQNIPTEGATDWEHFTIGSDTYLAVAHYYKQTTYDLDSKIYKWDGTQFVEFQSIFNNGAHDWEYFAIEGSPYLALTNRSNDGSFSAQSKIFQWDGSQFVQAHTVATEGALNWEHFTRGQDHYLALSQHYNDTGSSWNIDSKIFQLAFTPSGDIEAKVTIQEGEVTIGAPSLIQFPDTGVSDADQTVDVTVTDHFFVKDLKAAAAGYFTTLSVSDMVDGSKTIAADNMEIRVENGTVEALEGAADPNVTVPTATQTYTQFTSSSPITLLQRSADSDGLVGKYGVLPDFQLTIPAYQSLGSYTATMTYTLIEN